MPVNEYSLNDMLLLLDVDADPLEAAFLIAGFLRTAVQGEVSTFEGECASLLKAGEHFDLKSGDGIRAWVADIGVLASHPIPAWWWAKIADAAGSDDDDDLSDDDPDATPITVPADDDDLPTVDYGDPIG